MLEALVVPAFVVGAYDADTVTVEAHSWPQTTITTKIRVLGVDTPEIRGAECPAEKTLAIRARDYVRDLLIGEWVLLRDIKKDKYGGRFVADIQIDGVGLSDRLIELGFAVEYDGGTKVKDWCNG